MKFSTGLGFGLGLGAGLGFFLAHLFKESGDKNDD